MDWAVDIQFQHLLARQFGRDRCWLAGDAAHQTGPAAIQSMNVGLLEAEDLAGILSRILRSGASADLLQGYHRAHHDEWLHLLGAKGAPKPGPGTSPWISENCGRILSAIPASGQDLAALLAQLGLTLP
jgi:2-polyprenyl-6-methoxyphenol hydroxylase-like FAD-dependent oxidoreductase